MKRRVTVTAIVTAVVLAAPAAAAAKEPLRSLRVCGSSGCQSVHQLAARRALMPLVFGWSESLSAVPPAGAYYRLVPKPSPSPTLASFFVPPRFTVVEGHWNRLPQRLAVQLADAAAGLAPYQPHIASVTVNGHAAADPAAYAALLGPLPSVSPPAYIYRRRMLEIGIETTRPTPWTSGGSRIAYAYEPRSRLVRRFVEPTGDWHPLPAALERRVRSDAGLVAARESSSRASSIAGGGIAALALLAATAVLLRRRGSHTSGRGG